MPLISVPTRAAKNLGCAAAVGRRRAKLRVDVSDPGLLRDRWPPDAAGAHRGLFAHPNCLSGRAGGDPGLGLMLSGNAADFYRQAPWMILFPGVAISIAVFAFNLFGDSLRDYLDPRFKCSLALSSDIAGSRLR